jgi:hypothetical protein
MSRRGDPRVFAQNIRRLNALMGLSPSKAARDISKRCSVEIDPKWYRRLCRDGIGQVHKDAKERLVAIARFFGVTTVNALWDESLVVIKLGKRAVLPTEAEYTVKLVELLETKKHDYLRSLITSIHAMEFPDGVPEPEDEASFSPEYVHADEGDEDLEDEEDAEDD